MTQEVEKTVEGAPARILVADDQPDILEALDLLLRGNGYHVDSVNSPSGILEALRHDEFDLLLMDLNYARDTTSGREGLDLLSRLEAVGDVRVVVMTGWGNMNVAVEAMRRGVRDFIEKPWDNDRLLEILNKQVELGRSQRERRQRQAEEARQSAQAMVELRHLEEESEEARRVQRRLVPAELPQAPGYQIDAAWRPMGSVGGDYFDVLKFNDQSLALCIGDVTGKGVPAALLMSNLQATVHSIAGPLVSPSDLCARVNRASLPYVGAERFITFFYGLLDAPARRMTYVNAGHNPPLLVHQDGSCSRLREGGPVLAMVQNWNCRSGQVDFAPGDRLVLFTDGITEAFNARGEEFLEERLISLVTTYRRLTPAGIREKIMAALRDFTADHWTDDATLLVMSVEPDGN